MIVGAIDRSLLGEVRNLCFETRSPLNPWPERFTLSASPGAARLTSPLSRAARSLEQSTQRAVGIAQRLQRAYRCARRRRRS